MGKNKGKAATKAAQGSNATSTTPASPPAGAAGATPAAAKALYIQVLKGSCNFRGARGAWYARLQQYNGKPASEFLASCTANPPSLPKSGVAEPPQGWLSWFTRQGVCTVGEAATA